MKHGLYLNDQQMESVLKLLESLRIGLHRIGSDFPIDDASQGKVLLSAVDRGKVYERLARLSSTMWTIWMSDRSPAEVEAMEERFGRYMDRHLKQCLEGNSSKRPRRSPRSRRK